jgi:hypothetical protein
VKIALLAEFTSADAATVVKRTGALAQVEAALRRAHAQIDATGRRMGTSDVVERELKKEQWRKARVWSPDGLARPSNDSFDGWKVFQENGATFGIGVEIEWDYKRVYLDLLKLWRGQRGGQIRVGIIALRGPDTFHYAVHHQFALCRDLFGALSIAFCALDDPQLADPKYIQQLPPRAYPMP